MKDQRILITGGTGFLGRNLAIALRETNTVVLGGRNNKQNLQAEKMTGCQFIPMDVTRTESVRDTFIESKPTVVIHAAATKFVDRAEKHPMECIDVNVLGSQNIIRACLDFNTDVCVAISTDKAAPPIRNIYGLSKAVMERAFCGMNGKGKTKFTAVRYGNVAWSTGSVLPIWKQMHQEKGVIGTTGPEMTRFFFTVDEAVKLVLTAMEHIDEVQGRVLSRIMKAALIEDILKVWTEAKGGRWEKINGRPGERMQEFLIGETELEYGRTIKYDGIDHYIIGFNEKQPKPLPQVINSDNVPKLTKQEILDLINSPTQEL